MSNPATTPALELCLLGGVELKGAADGAADKLLAQSKAVALLAYLALAPAGRFQRRDMLVGLLWPDLDQAHARNDLRKVIHIIRTTLGDEILSARGDEEIAINSAVVRCDASTFRSAADNGRLAQALELYHGDLMPGFFLRDCAEFERWLEGERAELKERDAAASWAMAVASEGQGSYTLAGRWARRAVQRAWNNERILRRALSMLDRIGDRAGAMRLFDEFSVRLEKDLGVKPSRETVQLVESIRAR